MSASVANASQQIEAMQQKILRLEQELSQAKSAYKVSHSSQTSLEAEEETLKQERNAIRQKLERATNLRQACQRLTCADQALKKSSALEDPPEMARETSDIRRDRSQGPQVIMLMWGLVLGLLPVIGVIAYVFTVGTENVCYPKVKEPKQNSLAFDPVWPPLMQDGWKNVNASAKVRWGKAALHVCARGTSEVSFLRRDDCDGCLCPSGSVWIHYKDPRFFGNGGYCVPEQEWKTCVSKWSCCAHKPNLCWDFIFEGARKSPEGVSDRTVVVDSCSQHMSCYVLITRDRYWQLVSETSLSSPGQQVFDAKVGVALEEMKQVNTTLKMDDTLRGWGMPSSVMHLIKVSGTTSPQEWQTMSSIKLQREVKSRGIVRLWQLVSDYSITAKDMTGTEHVLAEWHQKEWNFYVDTE